MNRRPALLSALCILATLPGSAAAQIPPPPQSCSQGTAGAILEGRDTWAPVFNTGSLFFRDAESPAFLRNRRGENHLLAASFWIAAQFEGFLFMAASQFGAYEFWPGPLEDSGLAVLECEPYDRIFPISREDLRTYDRTGHISDDLRDWPWWAGAPVSDGDGDPTNYNLSGGDRPAVLGDRMMWWIMNDRGGSHFDSQATPLQIQVAVSAFAFNLPGVLGRTTFYRYRIVRKGIFPFVEARVGLYLIGGLGEPSDDYVGADTLNSMAYVYNADNHDALFGDSPPAVGIAILRGSGPDLDEPTGPRTLDARSMGSLVAYRDLCAEAGAPEGCSPYPLRRGLGYYNMMQGRWPWGAPAGVDGPVMYTAPPGAFPSEYDRDGRGTASIPGDRKLVVSTGPFTLAPDQTSEVVFAMVHAAGDDHLASVERLRSDMAFIHTRTADILTPTGSGRIRQEPLPSELRLSGPYPNPAGSEATFQVALPESLPVTVTLYDTLGREVHVAYSGLLGEGRHSIRLETDGLGSGIYVWRVETGRFSGSGTLVIQH